jgi:hypothetical protein
MYYEQMTNAQSPFAAELRGGDKKWQVKSGLHHSRFEEVIFSPPLQHMTAARWNELLNGQFHLC